MFGMALELNSSNSNQFSYKIGQLQNFMELQNSGAVVHFCLEFGSSSRNHYYGPRYGVGVKLPTIVIHYTKKIFVLFLFPRVSTLSCTSSRPPPPPSPPSLPAPPSAQAPPATPEDRVPASNQWQCDTIVMPRVEDWVSV